MADSTRLEAFSDAVFGFALTLLVVALEVPTSFEHLLGTMRGFVAFAASFAILYWIWYEHQRFFRCHPLDDGLTVFLNACLLFVVLFYVYPLKFMFTFLSQLFLGIGGETQRVTLAESRLLLVIYGCGFAAMFGIFALMYRHGVRRAGTLGLSASAIARSRAIAGSHTLSAGVGVISVVLAFVLPAQWVGLAGFVYAALGPLQAAHAYRQSRKAPA